MRSADRKIIKEIAEQYDGGPLGIGETLHEAINEMYPECCPVKDPQLGTMSAIAIALMLSINLIDRKEARAMLGMPPNPHPADYGEAVENATFLLTHGTSKPV